ncbi:DUF5615 family PIN-like protein [Leptolyngbya sp. PCC 6406]|uniref:DUF5615 family PIN-like protein n=1 Tax=Leptolyngbya sp. PCC 6406 TaxID=1173264 RepID=UPI0002ACB1A8|nr:DUF5615 family PIN-like protein [Leptolyngbya sp. PCC 6406]
MTTVRFYLDEDATSRRLLQALTSRGADVTSAAEADMLGQSDESQLAWAWTHQRVIYSFNVRDFYRLHSDCLVMGKPHAGIVLSRQGYSVGDQMRGLLQLAAMRSLEEMANTVEFLGAWINRLP